MKADTNPNSHRLIATVAIAILTLTALFFGGVALAGPLSADDTNDTGSVQESAEVAEEERVVAEAKVPEATPEPAGTPAAEPTVEATPVALEAAITDEPATGTPIDCEAFFAELDAEYVAQNEAFVEVLASFDITHKMISERDFTYVEVDYSDPIVEAISNSFWSEITAEFEPDEFDNPCYEIDEYEGEEGCLEDYEADPEEFEQLRAEFVEENDALGKAFTEAGIEFAWEANEYYELDMITWDYSDEVAIEVADAVFRELYPEDHHAIEGDFDEGFEEDFEAVMAERNATLQSLADKLAQAGVEHQLIDDTGWLNLTFDLDDDAAIAVVAAAR